MGTEVRARYDGLAEWYEQYNAPAAAANRAAVVELLGPGAGWCLDLGCGSGQYAAAIEQTGRRVVGVDLSADQLRLARTRTPGPVIRADAANLPFQDEAFPTVAAFWLSTDVDDFARVVREAARVLRPGGLLAYYGVHPCFNGPHTQGRPDGARIVHPTYRQIGWHQPAPWWGQNIRRRVGMRHQPLAVLLNAFLDAGLVINRIGEPRTDPVPAVLTIRAHKAHPGTTVTPPPQPPTDVPRNS